MAKLRNVQFYRNGQASVVEDVNDLKSAYKKAEQDFIATGKHNDMLDGEILLYRFIYDGTVHTLVGVVHVSEGVHSLEVLANYDMLGGEISDAINAALDKLDATVSDSNEKSDITVKVTQTDGKLTAVEVTDSLAEVAHTGAAANVSIADTDGVIEATTVEGALAEIAKEIDAMDSSLATTADSQANKLVKLGYTQVDGVITSLTSDETALEARLTAIENNAITGKEAIVVTPDTTTGNNEVSLKIAQGEKVLSQDVNGLKSTIALSYEPTTTTIKLTGINGANLGEIDATNFVKDGILQDVVIVEGEGVAEEGQTQVLEDGHRYFKFTYKTVYYDENNETVDTTKVVYLDVESLVDTYTAGNTWIEVDPIVNTISHKTQSAFTQVEGQVAPQTTFGANANATAEAAGESVEFKVPSFTVDAAGHVTEASEKTIKVALPATRTAATVTVTPDTELGLTSKDVQSALEELQGDINAINAVNWNGDGDTIEGVEGAGEIIVNDTTHTISHKQHALQTTASTNATPVKSVVIPQLTVNDYGHVIAIDNKTFEIDFNVPTVSGTAGQIVVTPSNETGEDVNYTVNLAKVAVAKTLDAEDDYAAGTETAPQNTHTRVEDITVDEYGRVTAYTLTTVEENWDCGIW